MEAGAAGITALACMAWKVSHYHVSNAMNIGLLHGLIPTSLIRLLLPYPESLVFIA
jgi:hypothetical protein